MEYITRVTWKRKSKWYYKVFINYIDGKDRKQYVKVQYPVNGCIEPHSRLGKLLKLYKPTNLSLFYIRKILANSYYQINQ